MKPLTFLSNASRAKDIFAVLAKHGFANLLTQLDPQGGLWKRIIPQPAERRTLWERVRLALEELGPTFVKAGQLMSMRPDALPHAGTFNNNVLTMAAGVAGLKHVWTEQAAATLNARGDRFREDVNRLFRARAFPADEHGFPDVLPAKGPTS